MKPQQRRDARWTDVLAALRRAERDAKDSFGFPRNYFSGAYITGPHGALGTGFIRPGGRDCIKVFRACWNRIAKVPGRMGRDLRLALARLEPGAGWGAALGGGYVVVNSRTAPFAVRCAEWFRAQQDEYEREQWEWL